jgi:hypothetical protein
MNCCAKSSTRLALGRRFKLGSVDNLRASSSLGTVEAVTMPNKVVSRRNSMVAASS